MSTIGQGWQLLLGLIPNKAELIVCDIVSKVFWFCRTLTAAVVWTAGRLDAMAFLNKSFQMFPTFKGSSFLVCLVGCYVPFVLLFGCSSWRALKVVYMRETTKLGLGLYNRSRRRRRACRVINKRNKRNHVLLSLFPHMIWQITKEPHQRTLEYESF